LTEVKTMTKLRKHAGPPLARWHTFLYEGTLTNAL